MSLWLTKTIPLGEAKGKDGVMRDIWCTQYSRRVKDVKRTMRALSGQNVVT